MIETLSRFRQSAQWQEYSRMVEGFNDYTKEIELCDTSSSTRSNQVLNLACLGHAGNFLNKLSRKMPCIKTFTIRQKIFYTHNTEKDYLTAINEPLREGRRRVAKKDYFERGFVRSMTIIRRKLSVIVFHLNLKEKSKHYVIRFMDFEWMTCEEHKNEFIRKFLDLLIV